MTHEDKKNLSKKHETEQIDPKAADAIEKAAENKLLTCADAHKIAKNLGLSPDEMGVQIDLLEKSIATCRSSKTGM